MKNRLDTNSHLSPELEHYLATRADFGGSDLESKTCGRWSCEEHKKFIEGLMKFGKNWKKVEEHIGTRSGAQIRSHAQKFFKRLEREYKKKVEDLPENRMRSDSFATQFSADILSDEEEQKPRHLDDSSQLLCTKLTSITEAQIESLQTNSQKNSEELAKLQKMHQLLSAYDNLLPPCNELPSPTFTPSDESFFFSFMFGSKF